MRFIFLPSTRMSKSFFQAVILKGAKIYDQIMVKTHKIPNRSKGIKIQLKVAQFVQLNDLCSALLVLVCLNFSYLEE